MVSVAEVRARRDAFILDNCAQMNAGSLAVAVYRELGEYVTANAVNAVIHRAKQQKDPRVQGRSNRRGCPKGSPFRTGVTRPKPTPAHRSEQAVVEEDAGEALPATALPFINVSQTKCKYPLRGSGIGLIVCGADVGGRPPYCPTCRAKTVLRKEL